MDKVYDSAGQFGNNHGIPMCSKTFYSAFAAYACFRLRRAGDARG